VRPVGTVDSAPTTGLGAHLSFGQFTQSGTSIVGSVDGGSPILTLVAANGGSITFSTSGGLQAPTTWLSLALGSGGWATGNIDVSSLDLFYSLPLGSSGAALFGTVNQVSGQAAAGVGYISLANANFRLNNCAISSVNCIILPVQTVPVGNPLENLLVDTAPNPNDQDDLLLPIVPNQDY
jgi:hypothetical protein